MKRGTWDVESTYHAPRTTFHDFLSPCAPFEQNPILAVAVSGGADSMALLLLAHDWAKARGGRAIALTVDHGLRPESAQEAAQVKNWCAARGIEQHTLNIHSPVGGGLGWGLTCSDPSKNAPLPTSPLRGEEKKAIQASAREARYRLLTGWCREQNILHLLTAHHQGDQAETLFFRLGRGSGLDGLACMPTVSQRHGVRLLRPLLSVTKPQLEATLQAYGQPWVEDPSNRKPDYTRNRLRFALEQTNHGETLTAQATVLAARFENLRNLLECNTARLMPQAVSIFPEGYGVIHPQAFAALAPEYGLRMLSALTLTLSGEELPSRSEKLERLYKDMLGVFSKRTFGGLLFIRQPRKNRILVCREPEAMEASVMLPAATPSLWDRRFQVEWTGGGKMLEIRALGADGLRTLGEKRPEIPEKQVLIALPSLWRLEELIAVPHIHYHHPGYGRLTFSARFKPAKTLG